MGLTNAVFGMYGGIIVISMPQLLSARGVAEATIAGMTAAMMSPGFWTFLISPVLDVRFSRRWYSVVTALAAAALLAAALLNLEHLVVVEGLLIAGYFFANLYQSALGGWLASITPQAAQSRLSVWVTIGNIGGGGAMAIASGAIVRTLSPATAAVLLASVLLLPLLVFPWMQAPGPDRRLARESFIGFFREVASLLRHREIVFAILLFLAPAATFSLTNFLSGVGHDFHASPQFVSLVGGGGVLLGGICGCLFFPLVKGQLPLRPLYLAIGLCGAVFTLSLILMPSSPTSFAIGLIGENVFQALAITAATAISFEAIGQNNPLAATSYCLMISAFNVPITYMLIVDASGYAKAGITGSYLADAGLSLLACLAFGFYLIVRARRGRAAAVGFSKSSVS
jgi:PAT family beta-lactamase induction signal transducer AmpG